MVIHTLLCTSSIHVHAITYYSKDLPLNLEMSGYMPKRVACDEGFFSLAKDDVAGSQTYTVRPPGVQISS